MWLLKTKFYCQVLFISHTDMLEFVDQYKIDSFECQYIKTFKEFQEEQKKPKGSPEKSDA